MDDNKNAADCQTDVVFSVYVIWCNKTNMHYVGVTSQASVYARIRQHKRGKKQCIDKEIRDIGWDGNFDWWIVEANVPPDLINEREQHWVAFFDCVYPNGYNKTHGGIGKVTVSEDTREKMSRSRRGKPAWNKGKTASPHTKARMSAKRKREKHHFYGKHHTAETRAKISTSVSAAITGEKNPFYGRHHTEESKAKMREKALARHAAQMTP